MRLLSLFSGIGAFEKALENIGEPFETVAYCEIDKYAAKAYSLIHGIEEDKNLKDVCKINTSTLPKIDLITYGFPCQDISLSGKQKGFTNEDGSLTRSGLFFEALRIIEETKPPIAIAENVKALVGKKFASEFQLVLDSLSDAGYKNYWAVLNAKDYGIPQNRERVFIISIRDDIDHGFQFPAKYLLKLRLKDLLENSVDDKYYISDKMISFFMANGKKQMDDNYIDESEARIQQIGNLFPNKHRENPNTGRVYDIEGISPTLNTMQGGHQQPYIINETTLRIRKLTPKECFRLMGFDDQDCDILVADGISNTQLYKMAGNSIVVDVLENIFQALFIQYSDVFPNNIKSDHMVNYFESDWESRQISIFDLLKEA